MPSNEVLASAAFFIASVLAALWSYLRKPPPPPGSQTAVLTGIGVELGNRQQMSDLVAAVNRVADAIEGKKQASIEGQLAEISEKVDEALAQRRR